jgi:UrcA family protein
MLKPTGNRMPRVPRTLLALEDHDLNTKANAGVCVRSRRLTVLGAATLLGLSQMLPIAAPADQPATSAPETRIARVALGDLDLSTAEGARVARDRLQEAARRLCVRLAESRDVGRQWHLRTCMNEAVADAWRQLTTPALASVRNSPTSTPNVAIK